jgi:hypothetical protein
MIGAAFRAPALHLLSSARKFADVFALLKAMRHNVHMKTISPAGEGGRQIVLHSDGVVSLL